MIDIRGAFEFEKGSIENAINIHTPDFLNDENLELFKEAKEAEKTIVLFGKNPVEVNLPFLLLYQLGFEDIMIYDNSLSEWAIDENLPIEKD